MTDDAERMWAAALALEDLGRSEEALDVAIEAFSASGGQLPAERCDEALDILERDEPTGDLEGIRTDVNEWLTAWWAWAALGAAVLFLVAGWLFRRSWWRERVKWPSLRIAKITVDASPTGLDLGDRLASTIRALLAGADKSTQLPSLRVADPGDTEIARLPLDPVPEQVTWVVGAWRWLNGRSTLHFDVLLSGDADRKNVSCIVRLDEPTGRPSRRRWRRDAGRRVYREGLIELPISGAAPADADYLALAGPSAAWLACEFADLRGSKERARLARLAGTSSWPAYYQFLLGHRASERGDLTYAARLYDIAIASHGESSSGGPPFYEACLNHAYVKMEEGPERWGEALKELKALSFRLTRARARIHQERREDRKRIKDRLDGLHLRTLLNAVTVQLNAATHRWLTKSERRDDDVIAELGRLLSRLSLVIAECPDAPLTPRVEVSAAIMKHSAAEIAAGWAPLPVSEAPASDLHADSAKLDDRVHELPPELRPHLQFSLACMWARRFSRLDQDRWSDRQEVRSQVIGFLRAAARTQPCVLAWVVDEPAFAKLRRDPQFRRAVKDLA